MEYRILPHGGEKIGVIGMGSSVIGAQPEEESPAESSLPAAVSTMTESVAETPDGFIFWPFALLLLAAAAGTTAVLLLRRRRSRRRAEEEYDEE